MSQSAYIVTGLGFGDEGKGTTVDYLTRNRGVKTVIRHNGGAQAGHNVVTDDGRHHTFAQFGSGTFAGARTFLSRFMVVHPMALLVEAKHLARARVSNPLSLVDIDRRALVITPFHQSFNRLLELSRGDKRHGTCGVGVGATVSDSYSHPSEAIRVGDLYDTAAFKSKLRVVQARKVAQAEVILRGGGMSNAFLEELETLRFLDIDSYARDLRPFRETVKAVEGEGFLSALLATGEDVVFEGAQGVLLDEWYGFHPHTTYSTCTHDNARTLLREGGYGGREVSLGVLRSYMTRHGQGPFPTETDSRVRIEPHNSPRSWQGGFRWGNFDFMLARYALEACKGTSGLVITHMDDMAWNPCDYYLRDGVRTAPIPVNHNRVENGFQDHLLSFVTGVVPHLRGGDANEKAVISGLQEGLGVPVVMASFGPTAESKFIYTDIFHRSN